MSPEQENENQSGPVNDSPAQRRVMERCGPWLKWLLAIGLLAALFWLNRETLAGLQERQLRWEFALAGFFCILAAILSTHVRWYLLVWAQEFQFPLKEAVRLGFLGYVSNYVAPGAIGGDAIKAVMIARQQESRRAVAVATIVLDRMLGLLALLVMGSAVWLIQSEQTQHRVFRTVAGAFFTGALIGLFLLGVSLHTRLLRAGWLQRCIGWKFVGRLLGELLGSVALYQARARVLWWTLALSLAGHAAMLTGFYCCARAVNPAESIPDFPAHLLFMPAAELAGMIPLFPGGLGALEGATAEFPATR